MPRAMLPAKMCEMEPVAVTSGGKPGHPSATSRKDADGYLSDFNVLMPPTRSWSNLLLSPEKKPVLATLHPVQPGSGLGKAHSILWLISGVVLLVQTFMGWLEKTAIASGLNSVVVLDESRLPSCA